MRIRGFVIAAAAVALAALGAGAAEKGGAKVTVQGEILDLACYVSHGAKGAGHADCAQSCLKGGQPMGLLAKDGTVYVLFADHGDAGAYNKAKEYAGKRVEVQGESAAQGSLHGITVSAVKPL